MPSRVVVSTGLCFAAGWGGPIMQPYAQAWPHDQQRMRHQVMGTPFRGLPDRDPGHELRSELRMVQHRQHVSFPCRGQMPTVDHFQTQCCHTVMVSPCRVGVNARVVVVPSAVTTLNGEGPTKQ